VVDVEQLYDQYAAGICKHPLAIRRFCDRLLTEWDSDPSHLFIIGKSIHEMNVSATVGARNDPEKYARNLVPTWGWPAADIPFTSGLNGTQWESAIPTGRLAAANEEQVLDYLNKVVQYESNTPAEWMKNIMHFGGGGNSYEQGLFRNYLTNYENIAVDTCFGGYVHSFFKTSTDPIQLNLSDSISLLIEEGVSLMTFFGHASSTGFDQNIDSPSAYSNNGKYPVLIGNSCYTGNIHLGEGQSTSEEFVLAPGAGVIAFMAKGDQGVPPYLNFFTENFYKRIFQKNYGASIGFCMVEAVKDFQGSSNDLFKYNTALTFGLHGDPALRINSHPLPDFSVQADRVFFEPELVTAQMDSLKVKVVLTNLGKAVNAPFGLEMIRHYPSGIDSSLNVEIDGLHFRDTVTFTWAVDRVHGVGLNTFDLFVDYPALLVEEMEEISNNIIQGKELLITSGDLIPVYPPEFAVIPNASVTLSASTGFPFLPERDYVIQIDTTSYFNSPFMQELNVSQSGGVVQWEYVLPLADETVYFWRASADSIDGDGYNWNSSSFQLIEGQTGWGQAHFHQLEKNKFRRLNYDQSAGETSYSTSDLLLKCQVYGAPSTNFEVLATRYQIDLEVMDYAGCGITPAFMVAVIDSVSLAPWESNYLGQNPGNDFGNLMSCADDRGRPEKYFIFRQNNSAELAGFQDMIENQVPNGNYLLIYSWKYVNYDGWEAQGPETFDVFANLGAQQIGLAQDSVPFIFFMKMGYPETMVELYGDDINAYLELNVELQGILGVGEMTSTVIGPAPDWEAAYWQLHAQEQNGDDSTRIHLFGVKPSGDVDELYNFEEDPNAVPDLASYVDAAEYSRLTLKADLTDFQTQTPPQLDSWHVIHGPIPEAAVDPNLHSVFESDTVAEGQNVVFAVAIRNVGEVDMDSLLVKYWVEDHNRQIIPLSYQRQDSLRVGDVFIDTIQIETSGLGGSNLLWMEINPINPETGDYDQLESYHFNNIAQRSFLVIEDRINPLLDVTFDGQHILHGDIVSTHPEIMISLDDESQFFIIDQPEDTSLFKLYLTTPQVVQRPIYFSNPAVQWVPATAPDNKTRIEYRPEFTLDGEYELLVQARDKSGNESGDFDFRIGFEVITQNTITEVLNYPNPFSTRTQFVFTLTGQEVPDYVLIQIMTVGGRVVREITTEELGPLNIGRNFTDFWWDGTDEFGDRLANGVYLYRVTAKLGGEHMELRQTDASGYFKKGFGKMYLMR
jgi:hypothetical protein